MVFKLIKHGLNSYRANLNICSYNLLCKKLMLVKAMLPM